MSKRNTSTMRVLPEEKSTLQKINAQRILQGKKPLTTARFSKAKCRLITENAGRFMEIE